MLDLDYEMDLYWLLIPAQAKDARADKGYDLRMMSNDSKTRLMEGIGPVSRDKAWSRTTTDISEQKFC